MSRKEEYLDAECEHVCFGCSLTPSDVQRWQFRMKYHKNLITNTYNELPLAETSEIISE